MCLCAYSLVFVCISICIECVRANACVHVNASCVWRCYKFYSKAINLPRKQTCREYLDGKNVPVFYSLLVFTFSPRNKSRAEKFAQLTKDNPEERNECVVYNDSWSLIPHAPPRMFFFSFLNQLLQNDVFTVIL